MNKNVKNSLPFILSIFLVGADQLIKKLVVLNIPEYKVAFSWLGDFLWIIHVKNTGIAFSLGDSFPTIVRLILFIIVPLAVMAGLAVYIVINKELTTLQRWALAGILGGGLGNLVDRIFRPDGVVDYVSVKFYGLLGMERFPVFNLADSAVVICGILILITFILEGKNKDEQKA